MVMRKLYDTQEHDTNMGELDLRGWHLKDEEGRIVGEIDDLLVDSEAGKIRYAVASMPRRVLLPVGILHLEEKDRTVTARGYSRALLGTLTEYEEGEFTGGREEQHYVETVQPDHRDYRDVMQDTSLERPMRETTTPVNYAHDRFQVRNERMQEIENRFREIEDRRRDRNAEMKPVETASTAPPAPVDRTREVSFSAAEPSEEEMRNLEPENTVEIERTSQPRKTIIDLRPLE